jgi:two-component system, OmpR family, alkaline phosphatase synthesis response regulator PhoP
MTKIMIVDDEQDLREMIELMLHKEGFVTHTAENGLDLLNKIDDFQPDLVTLDVMMPGLTTREILDKLKEKKTKPKIILLTVIRYSDEEKQKLVQMGIVDYVTKPFELDNLINTIHNHVLSSPAL